METVYRLGKGWKFFYLLGGVILILAGLSVLIISFPITYTQLSYIVLSSIAGIILILIGILTILKGTTTKLIFTNSEVLYYSIFQKRMLKYDEIKGYRKRNNTFYLIPKLPSIQIIGIRNSLEEYDEIVLWLEENFKYVEISSPRIVKLKPKSKKALPSNGSGLLRFACRLITSFYVLVFFYSFIFPHPYHYLILFHIISPFLIFIIVKLSKGKIGLNFLAKNSNPSLAYPIILSALSLAIRGLFDFNIFSFESFWPPFVIFLTILSGLILLHFLDFGYNKLLEILSLLCLTFFFAIYSFGATIFVNCYYDFHTPETFSATVLKKEKDPKKIILYSVKLSPWGPIQNQTALIVPDFVYNEVIEGEIIEVRLHKGLLAIPWYGFYEIK